MNKDFKSDYDEWLIHEKAWESQGAKDISSSLNNSLNVSDEVVRLINTSGLEGIGAIKVNITKQAISRLEEDREKLALFCKKIHIDIEDMVDDVFNYGVMKTLADIYALNPNEVTLTSGGKEYQLESMMKAESKDPALKAEFSKKAKQLDKDKLTNGLKTGLIDAISRYYDGDVAPYMANASGYNKVKFNKDMKLVIEYYEYLNPKDAKTMNNFLAGPAKDKDKRYLEDINNIKFIAYTAREPYKSVFFKYLKKIKIADYDYHELNSKGEEKSQYYSGDSKSIYIRFYGNNEGKDDLRGPYVTLFHEIGHGIDDLTLKDNKLLFWTTNVNYTTVDDSGVTAFDAATNDVRANISESVHNYIVKNGITKLTINENEIVQAIMTYSFSGFKPNTKEEEVYNEVIEEYGRKFSVEITNATIYCGISDVYGGYTDNKLRGVYGHDNKIDGNGNTYWNDLNSNNEYSKNQGKELWAEAFSRYMTSNDEAIEEMEKYFPTAMKVMTDKILR